MKRALAVSALAFAVGFFSVTPAVAESAVGEAEYRIACANCHGETGQGDGPLAEFLSVAVPDLTVLAANNSGQFPFLQTMMVIDGRTGVRGHGGPMPVWGDRYERDALGLAGVYGTELIVRGRLVALVEYLAGLQR